MIPRANITAWRSVAPWPTDEQVEQDLIISRALVSMYGDTTIADALAFRGGTALHKLFTTRAMRYSEDIDLVQIHAGPIGPCQNAIRSVLDGWLGEPTWRNKEASVVLYYRFESTAMPVTRMRLKIEIHTREHFSVLGFVPRLFQVSNPWFTGRARITTCRLEELLGTKLRALFQRKKGRDLFDLWYGMSTGESNPDDVVACFLRYMEHAHTSITRARFEENLAAKMADRVFLEDVRPLLPPDHAYDPREAAVLVRGELLSRLPGDPWRGAPSCGS